MFDNLQQRLTSAQAATPREEAAILFGTTAITLGLMSSAIAISATDATASSILTSKPVEWLSIAIISVAAYSIARRIRSLHLPEFRGRSLLAIAPMFALLIGLSFASGNGASAQEATYVSGDVLVTTDDLNLRDDASIDATLIETLPAGTPVTITSDPITGGDYVWYAVASDYGDGYVAGDYLADPATIPTGTSVAINTDELNLRAAAGVDSEVLSILDSGTEITIVSEPTVLDGITWYQVDTAAGSGWVAGEFLITV